MIGERWFWVGLALFAFGGYWAILDEMQNKYEQGYAAGANSLSDKYVDQVCMQWLFQSNLKQAKKRACGNGNN